MDEVYINTYDMAKWIREKYFNNKNFITLDDLYRAFEELSDDYENLQEEFNKMTQDTYDEHEDYC